MQHFKHLLLTSLLAMASAAGAWADTVDPVKPSGTGTEGDPYLIATPANLLWVGQNALTNADGQPIRRAHYKLTADLDMSTVCGDGVGHWQAMFTDSQPFAGVFDGDGHTISHLYSHKTGEYLGLFRYLGECTIKDLTLADVDFSGTYTVGGLTAYCKQVNDNGANVSGVRVTGSIATSGTRIGAIVGNGAHGTFTNCVNEATLTCGNNGSNFIGGIIGQGQYGTLTLQGCINKGTINASEGYAAGIICQVGQEATITDCLNLGTINAATNFGYNVAGIVGCVQASGLDVTIDHCFNNASVTGNYHCSYLVGNARSGNTVLTNCYWNSDATLTRYDNASYNLHDYCGYIEGSLEASNCQGLTAEQIAAGAAAFLLQDGRPETAWGQNLAASETHPTPSTSNRVYLSEGAIDCLGQVQGGGSYTNTPGTGTVLGHTWQNGYCTTCHDIEGTPSLVDGYYQIGNAGHLLWFARQSRVNNTINAKLTADIDLAIITHPADAEHGIEAAEWEMIGYDSDAGYTGIFDGQGHTVSNYYICDKGNVGFFRTLAGTVRNLKLAGGLIESSTGRYKMGLLAGSIIYGTASDVEILSGFVNVGTASQYTGGLIGDCKQQASCIEDCIVHSGVTVCSGTFVGGIVGNGSGGHIDRCSNYATVQGQDAIGGIVGNGASMLLTDCHNAGNVVSNNSYNKGAAGIAADGNSSTRLINCLNTGNVTASRTNSAALISNVGYAIAITNCYASADVVVTENGTPVAEPRLYHLASGTPESGTVVAEQLTAGQLTNGYAAFMLQAQRDDRDYWGQELGVDNCPVVGSSHRVYLNGHLTCGGEVKDGTYSNAVSAPVVDAHTWTADHICSTCGTAEEPALSGDVYQIANVGNLVWFQREVTLKANNSINAALTADLNLSAVTDAEHPWASIGSNANEFKGTFDGQGHTITGLTFNDTKTNYGALFGYTHYANIRNLKVQANINGKNYAAVMVGYASETKFTNCTTSGSVSGVDQVGGFVGQAYSSEFTDCTNYAAVTSNSRYVGGLIGYAQYGKMNHCFNHGDVSCTWSGGENNVGGLVGRVYDGMKVDRCANYGNVTGAGTSVGGLIGYNSGSSSNNHVYYCANHGNVSGKYAIGGLCGWMQGQDWNHCFNAGDVVAKEEGNNGRTFGYYVTVDNFDNIYYDATRTYTEVRVEEGTKRVAFSQQQLESGEAAYTLGAPFGQKLGTDPLPRLDAPQVYYGRYQHAVAEPIFAEDQYSNLIVGDATTDHHYDDGVCTICGKHDAYIWETTPSGAYADWTSTNKGEHNSESSHVYTIAGAEVGNHISFDWTVSSEANCDWLYAELTLPDGTKKELVRQSGRKNDSTPYSGSINYEITAAGTYLLTVRYIKDSSANGGDDEATITNLLAPKLAATSKIYGDIDGDDAFDLNDVNAIKNMVADPTSVDSKADLNGDGDVTIGDVTEAIRQLIMP